MGFLSRFFGRRGDAPDRPVLTPLSVEQLRDVQQNSRNGRAVLTKYLGHRSRFSPEDFDAVITQWRQAPRKEREDRKVITAALGAALGDLLAHTLNLEWQNYTDRRGTDLCVVHREVGVFSFPVAVIQKAVDGRANALGEVEATLKYQIADTLADPQVMQSCAAHRKRVGR